MNYFIVPEVSTGLKPLEIDITHMRSFHKIIMMRRYPLNPNNAGLLHDLATAYGPKFVGMFLRVGLFFNSISETEKYVPIRIVRGSEQYDSGEKNLYTIHDFLDFCEKEFEGEIECQGHIIS